MTPPSARRRSSKVVILAPSAFKGTLAAAEICRVLEGELGRCGIPSHAIPVADGGDGTLEALQELFPLAKIRFASVTGPDGRNVRARVLVTGRTRFIEMAEAAGLRLMRRPNPWRATTFGVGELVSRSAPGEIVIGIGGSATNDAGAGMLQALGARLVDRRERPIPRGGGGLGVLRRIEWPERPRWKIMVLSDVDNPLLGPEGASRTFGPQKGADPTMVRRLERNLRRFAAVVRRDLGIRLQGIVGGGAAGGLGAALIGILGARRERGADYILRRAGFARRLRSASAVVTGEGRIDRTTFRGKATGRIVSMARRAGVPVFILAGSSAPSADKIGARDMVTAAEVAGGPERAISKPRRSLRAAARRLARSIQAALKGVGGPGRK